MNFKSLQLGSSTSLLIKIRTITINTFVTIEMFVYYCSLKIQTLGFNKLLERIFLPSLLVVKTFSLQKVVKILGASQLEVLVSARGQVNVVDEAKTL